ncbi:MAG: Proline-rich protein [Myxococcaceae bacterium]|nr:Proline-rich protein [Myxococcaceae bacterium]
MDVICERCKAEYEFDEALLGEKGTTVKCSACGHVFRVLPPSRDLARSHLKLRYASDGTVKSLSSLRELQQRIRAGEVSLDDELGRDGFPFRPLREVPELKNFFAAPIDKLYKTPLESTAVRPDASRLGDVTSAERTVEARIPGSSAGATIAGRAETQPTDATPSVRPVRPSLGAREAAAPPAARSPGQPVPAERAAFEAHAKPGAASSSELPEPKLPSDARRRSFTKHTMMGVGPDDLQLPPPPRMPNFAGQQPAPSARPRAAAGTPVQPTVERSLIDRVGAAPASPHGTLHGVPAPQFGLAGGPASSGLPHPTAAKMPAHANASYDRGGTLPPLHGVAAEAPSAFGSAHDASSDQGASSPTDALVARLQANATAPSSGLPNAAHRLYLEDEERGPGRADESGSKPWLTVMLVLVLGGGGWLGWRALESSDEGYVEPTAEPEAVAPGTVVDATSAIDAPHATDTEVAELGAAPVAETELKGEPAASDAAPPAATPREPTSGQPSPAPPTKARVLENAERTPKPSDAVATKETSATETAHESAPVPSPGSTRVPSVKPERDSVSRPAERPTGGSPEDYSAWISKGDQLFARGDQDGAQKAFRAALALRASGSEANTGLGFALLSAGKTREALPYFDAAASSGYAEANIGLGDAYRKLGQPSSAIEAYQGYLDRLSKGARAEYARSQIEKLKSGAAGEPKRAPVFGVPRGNDGYRPAGEFTEPAAPSAPAPANPSEITP